MKKIKSIEIKKDKVKIVVEDRDLYGTVRRRQQMTFGRRHFETALQNADITVPWKAVNR